MQCRSVALALCLGGSQLFICAAQAGLYNTEDPRPPRSMNVASEADLPIWPTEGYPEFKLVIEQLRGVIDTQRPSELRKRYLQRIAELETKQRAGGLTTEDRVNLSAYYIRLQRHESALGVLEPLRSSSNFMALSNLGTAYERLGHLDQAISYSTQALKAWPTTIWPGLDQLQLSFLNRAERYHITLLKLRLVEKARPSARSAEKVDALFSGVHFTRPDGTYKAYGLEPAQLAELPKDHILVVEQLLFWDPTDLRLYWLLGELLNAQGFLLAACEQFDLTSNLGYSSREMLEHRSILIAVRDSMNVLNRHIGALSVLRWSLTPRGVTLEPGIGALVSESAPFAREYLISQSNKPPAVAPQLAPAPSTAPVQPGKNLMQDLRTAAISFAAGCLVTLLIIFQFRETRRRLQAPAAKSEA